MKKKTENRGGVRVGAGRPKKEGEIKSHFTIYLYPTDKARIIKKYGSLQKWADTHIPKIEN